MEEITIGRKLKKLREERALTQEQFAETINVTRQTVSHWENGKRTPDIYIICRIAEYYEITLDELCGNIVIEEKITVEKSIDYIVLLSVFFPFMYLVIGMITKHFYVGIFIMMLVIGIPGAGLLHLILKGAIEDNNFGILAGFDSEIEYNLTAVKKMLKQCNIHIAIMTLLINCFLFLSAYSEGTNFAWKGKEIIGPSFFPTLLILYYSIDLTAIILFHNIKSRKSMFKNEKDLSAAKAGTTSLIWYFVEVFILIGSIFIRNGNLKKDFFWFYFILLISTAALFYEQHRVKLFTNKQKKYHLGILFYIVAIVCFILSVKIAFMW